MKKIFFMYCYLSILLCCCNTESIKKYLPIVDEEPKNLDFERLKYDYLNPSIDDSSYEDTVNLSEELFFSICNNFYKKEYIGEWILVDENLCEVKSDMFLSPSTFTLKIVNDEIYYQFKDNICKVYENCGRFYFNPSVYSEILRQFIIVDNKLYIYNLDKDKWFLDQIHEDGYFYYLKKE